MSHPSWHSWRLELTVSCSIIQYVSACYLNSRIVTQTALPSKMLLTSIMPARYITILLAGTIWCGQNRQVVGAPALQGRGA